MKNQSWSVWVYWIAATALAAITLCSFAYTNFETKKDADDKKADLVQRLDRIELKLDRVKESLENDYNY